MTWEVRAPAHEGDVVRVVIAGVTGSAELQAAFQASLEACLAYDRWLVLTDLTAMRAGHTVVDLFGLIAAIGELDVRGRFREALVVGDDPATVELAHFFETAGVNRGLSVRAFTGVDTALAWLTPGRSAPVG